jgi:uncharacterized protein (DUF2141 family)
MKRVVLIWCMMAALVVCGGQAIAADGSGGNNGTGVLLIVLSGFNNDKGDAKIALFQSKEGFTKEENPFRGAEAPIKGRQAECAFQGLPFGVYAVKAYHDENLNGKLDKNMLGQPKEQYGFSNNARATFGPPGFEESKFIFDGKNSTITITME